MSSLAFQNFQKWQSHFLMTSLSIWKINPDAFPDSYKISIVFGTFV